MAINLVRDTESSESNGAKGAMVLSAPATLQLNVNEDAQNKEQTGQVLKTSQTPEQTTGTPAPLTSGGEKTIPSDGTRNENKKGESVTFASLTNSLLN